MCHSEGHQHTLLLLTSSIWARYITKQQRKHLFLISLDLFILCFWFFPWFFRTTTTITEITTTAAAIPITHRSLSTTTTIAVVELAMLAKQLRITTTASPLPAIIATLKLKWILLTMLGNEENVNQKMIPQQLAIATQTSKHSKVLFSSNKHYLLCNNSSNNSNEPYNNCNSNNQMQQLLLVVAIILLLCGVNSCNSNNNYNSSSNNRNH